MSQSAYSTYVTFLDYALFFLNTASKFWFKPWSPLIWIILMPFSLISSKTLKQESSSAQSSQTILHLSNLAPHSQVHPVQDCAFHF